MPLRVSDSTGGKPSYAMYLTECSHRSFAISLGARAETRNECPSLSQDSILNPYFLASAAPASRGG